MLICLNIGVRGDSDEDRGVGWILNSFYHTFVSIFLQDNRILEQKCVFYCQSFDFKENGRVKKIKAHY